MNTTTNHLEALAAQHLYTALDGTNTGPAFRRAITDAAVAALAHDHRRAAATIMEAAVMADSADTMQHLADALWELHRAQVQALREERGAA